MKARKPLTTIVGACLAAVAAGCLVLFSLLIQNVTLGVSDEGGGVKIATPEETSPVISLPGRSGTRRDARTGDGSRATEDPVTGPLALLVEPLAPGDSLADLAGPGGGTGSTSSSAGPGNSNSEPGNSNGSGGDRVAAAPDRLGRGPRTTLDTNARAVRTAILALRAQDQGTGRPAPGDGGNGRPGKGNGAGGDKGQGHPGRGLGAGGNSKNDKGKAKGRPGKDAKPKKAKGHGRKSDAGNGKGKSHGPKNKAAKAKRSSGGGHQTSSAAPKAAKARKDRAPSHSSGPPAHSKSKAPKKTPPGHAKGGPPGKAKGKKR